MDINIFLPNFTRLKECGSIQGYVVEISEKTLGIYICHIFTDNKLKTSSDNLDSNLIYGDIFRKNDELSHSLLNPNEFSNFIALRIENKAIHLEQLKINLKEIDIASSVKKVVILFYNYEAIVTSECLLNNENIKTFSNDNTSTFSNEKIISNQFDILKCIVDKSVVIKNDSAPKAKSKSAASDDSFFPNIFNKLKPTLQYSNLYIQLFSYFTFVKWIFSSIYRERKVSVQAGNLLCAMLFDFLGGILVLYWIKQWATTPVNQFFNSIELIVDEMKTLLGWLMGSPAGLKLNHAFNNMLGKFFLYHIDLWWMFLIISKDTLESGLEIFQYLGLMGITLQAAILADLLSLASLHIYCIYTYAASLYNIQVSGLIALWRLFLGRKQNPLRGGVDSCQYSHHQLFVGTLAFTVLLFLLPTTALYYAVFTTFRILFLFVGGILTRLQYRIQSLPLYLFALWLVKSPKIAGDVRISCIEEVESTTRPLMLLVDLKTASFLELVGKCRPPPVCRPAHINWKLLLNNLCRGNQMYSV